MPGSRQFRQDEQIPHGTNAQSNLKMTDIMPVQHEDLASNVNQMKKISIGQCLCEPYAVCNSNDPENGAYVADCVNFPDFALSFTDGQGNSHALVGLKIRVLFTYGITYGSVSGGTYPTLNINGSGAIPLLAQGKTMGAGAISAGQTVEFTIIPYGNGLAFDADSNVRESNSDYTVHTDGSITYKNIMLCQKIDMPIFSTTDVRYVKVVFNFSTNKWDGVKMWLRVRYDNLQAILYENDDHLYMQRVFLNTVGFFADLKYSVSEHTFFFTIPNYSGAPVLYFEKTKEDTIDYVSYEVKNTPFTYPSDTVDV